MYKTFEKGTSIKFKKSISLFSCTNKGAEAYTASNKKYLCGAYAGNRALTEEDIQVFKSAYNYKLKMTPQSVSTQVVAGTNYKFICTDESDNVVEVMIFKPLPNQGKAKVSSIKTVSGQDTPEIVATIVQIMYDDIMSMYYSGEEGQEFAFSKYASTKLQKLLYEVENAINKGDVEPIIYGWDCDPWIMAQDWSHPIATVVRVHALSDKNCMADVVIRDGDEKSEPTNLTITLVKEEDQWKVDDFASLESDINTFAKMLKEDYESAKSKNISGKNI